MKGLKEYLQTWYMCVEYKKIPSIIVNFS